MASDREYDSELNFHIEKLIAEKIAAGLSPEEARRQALLEFGRPTQLKEELRDVYRWQLGERTAANLRLAVRLLRKSPAFSFAAIATLALGIGANSSVFSAVNAILLRPLPFPNGDELIKLSQIEPKSKNPQSFVAPVRLEDWNRLNATCQAVSGWYLNESSETTGALPERVQQALVAPRFLQVWGVQPAFGRDFKPEEEHWGGRPAVLISDRYWRRKFHADPNVIGRRLRIEGGYTTVIGVMPAGFLFPEREVDLWTMSPPDAPFAQSRFNTWYTVVARMKPGVNVEQARADLNAVQTRLGRQFPQPDKELAVNVAALKEDSVHSSRRSLLLLFAAVSLLLLIACTNIAALLLARATERGREIAVRFSLGASRASIVWQLLTEYFVLALAGSIVGLAIAWGATFWLRHLTKALPRAEEVTLDWRLVLYTLGCACAATLLCGLLPALGCARRGISGELAFAGRAQVSTRSPWQWFLAAVQVALAVTLLSGAGLLLRTFQELGRVSLGYDPARVLVLRISGNWGETTDGKKLLARVNGELNTLRETPGVKSAATSGNLPGAPSDLHTDFRVTELQQSPISADTRTVSDGYFQALRIPVLAGAACEPDKEFTVVVNRTFANRYIPGSPAVGHHLQLVSTQFKSPPFLVKGMVADAREQSANREPYPTVYWCSAVPYPTPYFLVRTAGEPMSMAQTLRRRLNDKDPSRSVFGLSPLADHLAEGQAENRLRTLLLTLFALTALTLAAVGLYGTLNYLVTVRRREVALRLALGALRHQIVGYFLRLGVISALSGLAAGIALSAFATRWLAGMLYGVARNDSTTYLAVLVVIFAAAILASLAPSLRASRVEPMAVLRDE